MRTQKQKQEVSKMFIRILIFSLQYWAGRKDLVSLSLSSSACDCRTNSKSKVNMGLHDNLAVACWVTLPVASPVTRARTFTSIQKGHDVWSLVPMEILNFSPQVFNYTVWRWGSLDNRNTCRDTTVDLISSLLPSVPSLLPALLPFKPMSCPLASSTCLHH